MSSASDTLKTLLGDNAEEKLQSVINSLSDTKAEKTSNASAAPDNKKPVLNADGLNYLLRIKDIIDEMGNANNDYRSNLLLSLKPFMRSSRQQSIDSAVRILNLTRLTSVFK